MASQSWNLCICGDVEGIFGILAEETDSVAQLKERIQRRSQIPQDEQTLYFQENFLQDDQLLRSYPEITDGAMIYLARKPLSLHIYSLLWDTPVEVQIKLGHEIKDQTVYSLKTIICDRIGIEPDVSCIILCAGEVLKEQKRLHDYPTFTDGARIVLRKAPLIVYLYDQSAQFKAFIPQGTKVLFLKQQLSAKTGTSMQQLESGAFLESQLQRNESVDSYLGKKADYDLLSGNWNIRREQGWILDVQRLDGSKTSVFVTGGNILSLPIVKLRECIEERTGVPTHQQRLTIGSTILEDWDTEDRMMFVGDYPAIHSGSLLYLIQLEGRFRMKVTHQYRGYKFTCFRKREPGTVVYHYQTTHFYINASETEWQQIKESVRRKVNGCGPRLWHSTFTPGCDVYVHGK